MNIFCTLYGHTWIHEAQDPKISWNTDKKQVNLTATVEGEPRFNRLCVRCGERRPWETTRASAPEKATGVADS
jgi:hypothetical protein